MTDRFPYNNCAGKAELLMSSCPVKIALCPSFFCFVKASIYDHFALRYLQKDLLYHEPWNILGGSAYGV